MVWNEERITNAIRLMRPSPSPYILMRIGPNLDGSYLLPDDLEGVAACFSPGVSNWKAFEDELAVRFGIRSHLCDFSSDESAFATPLMPQLQTFEKKWLDLEGVADAITLDEWVARREPDPTADLILQMDIESAEYRNLLAVSDSTLRRFRIMVIEFHNLAVAHQPPAFGGSLGAVLERLDKDFISIHAHANNCCGEVYYEPAAMHLPNVIELTFLRRDRFQMGPPLKRVKPRLPHPADVSRNVPHLPPLFLDAGWLDGPRPEESKAKMNAEKLAFLEYEAAMAGVAYARGR